MALRPDLPVQQDSPDATVPASPTALASWLATLPAGGEGLRGLLDGLKALNRRLLPPQERAALLAVLQPAVRERLDLDQHRVRGQRFPLPARSRQRFEVDQTLREESAFGHLQIAVDLAATTPGDEGIAQALTRALRYYGEYLLRTTQLYTPPPERFWHNVHAAYALAEQTGQESVAADGGAPVDQYKRILLFDTGHTHGLLRNDAERVYELLAVWALRTELDTEAPAPSRYAFGIDLAQAQPPRRLQLVPRKAETALRVFTVDGAIAAAERLQRIRGPADATGTVSPAGLTRLLGNWRQETLRRSTRRRREQRVDVEVTLGMIRDRLEGRADTGDGGDQGAGRAGAASGLPVWKQADEMRDPYAGFVSHPLRAGQGQMATRRDDVWSRSVERKSDAYFRGRSAVEAAGLEPAVRNPHQAWRLLDISPNGFGLEWVGRGNSNATVGELLGLAVRRHDQVRWRLGVIRWLRFTGPTRFVLGAQVLALEARAGGVTRPARSGVHDPEEPALLIGADPADDDTTEESAILLPAAMFAAGDELELRRDDQDVRIALGERREETGSFALFEFSIRPRETADEIPEWEIL